jgi:hypothetical protein
VDEIIQDVPDGDFLVRRHLFPLKVPDAIVVNLEVHGATGPFDTRSDVAGTGAAAVHPCTFGDARAQTRISMRSQQQRVSASAPHPCLVGDSGENRRFRHLDGSQ